jgi:very-short-patch-repair endonuclease
MAAVLCCGEGTVLSHRSAAALWRLLPPRAGPVHVSLPSGSGRKKRQGLIIHRRVTLSDTTQRYGIPVTTPAQTVDDLRREISAAEFRRAVRQAEVLGLRTGIGESSEGTRSELEHLFLRLCRRSGLPKPEVNVHIDRHVVDFLWRERRLIVETDGYRYHRGRTAFEDDHARDLELRAQGYDVLRFTYRQVIEKPTEVAALLAASLAATTQPPGLPS